jgi:hypothetical protein
MSWIPRARGPWVVVPCAWACILVAFSASAIAAPGAALPISDNDYSDWALGDQVEPAAATLSSGSPFWTTITLIVWEDHRGPDVDIWGARIDSSDQLLDVGGFPICTAAGDQRLPDVTVRVGTYERDFLVVWEDWRTGNADIYATRVSNSGVVGDGGPSVGGFAISTGAGNQTRPAVSNVYPSGFLNSQCLVVWEDDRFGIDQVRASRLSGASVLDDPVDAGGLLVSVAASPAQTPDTAGITAPLQGHVVVYHDLTLEKIRYASVDKDGVVRQIASGWQSGPLGRPSVGTHSNQFLVAWHHDFPGFVASHEILGELRTYNSTTSSWDVQALTVASADWDQLKPQVALNGTGYVVAWEDFRINNGANVRAYAARVSSSGVVQDPSGIDLNVPIGENGCHDVCIATGVRSLFATDWTIAFSRWVGTTTQDEIEAAHFEDAVRETLPVAHGLSKAANRQAEFDLAFDGQVWMGAWVERGEVRCGRVDPDTGPLDGSGRVLGTGTSPNIVWLGSVYLVSYVDAGAFRYRRLDSSGVPIEPAPITLASGVSTGYFGGNAAAAIGDTALLVWVTGSPYSLRAARIAADGSVLTPSGGIEVCDGAGWQTRPDVSAGPNGYLVVWTDLRYGNDDIYAMRLSSEAEPLDTTMEGIALCTHSADQRDPAVAWNGQHYLVAWRDQRDPNASIYGCLVELSGTVTYTNGVALVPGSPEAAFEPAVGGTNGEWWLAWSGRYFDATAGQYLHAARARRLGGSLQNLESVTLAEDIVVFPEPVLAGRTHLALAYRHEDPEEPWCFSPRGFVRFVGDGVTSVDEPPTSRSALRLGTPHPSPFNPRTSIAFELPRAGHARVDIVDVRGRVVCVLVDESRPAGRGMLTWDGCDAEGRSVASGAYVVRLEFDGQSRARKVVLVR